jgi:fatty acid CoA ligase FadD36
MGVLRGMYETDRADAVQMVDGGMSTQQLLGCAGALAERIRGAAAVAVLAEPTLSTVVAVLAGLLAGVPVVPLPPDAGYAEREHVLRDSGAELLLGATTEADRLPGIPVELSARSGGAQPAVDPDRVALILYTSGTTGPAKGVLLSHRAIAADLDALAQAWAWSAADVLVHGLPLFHVHGLVLGVLGALRTGSRLVHVGRPDPQRYAAAGGTLYFGVPTVWSRVCADEPAARALRAARLLVSGSAPLPVSVFERLRALTGMAPVERYGMTETLITLSSRADGPRRAGLVGTPLAGVSTRLVGEDGAPVPSDGGSIGELQVRGGTLFDGYLNLPEATGQSWTADGWFRTGDVATVAPDGWHRIVGRASTDLIKSGGYRIGAGEVEDALLAHPAVREAAVVGSPHPDLGEQVTAYVVGAGVTGAELIDFVARRLAVHKRPRQVILLDELPRNALGKVQKRLLADRATG